MIGQFSGLYSLARRAKISRFFLLPNCVIYHKIFLACIASKSLKVSFTLNCVLKRANDLRRNPIEDRAISGLSGQKSVPE